MLPELIIERDVTRQTFFTFFGALEGHSIGPFLAASQDEALGLAVGAGCVRLVRMCLRP